MGTGEKGSSGDGGPRAEGDLERSQASLRRCARDVIIADTENHRIRVYHPSDGTIQSLAGTGRKGTAGVGKAPAEAEFNQPHGVTLASDGTLFISDSSNHRILKLVP